MIDVPLAIQAHGQFRHQPSTAINRKRAREWDSNPYLVALGRRVDALDEEMKMVKGTCHDLQSRMNNVGTEIRNNLLVTIGIVVTLIIFLKS